MKKWLAVFICCLTFALYGQNTTDDSVFLEANYFYGSIVEHNKDVAHLITGHPEGIILSYNKRSFGEKPWQALYNYPDFGFSFIYQDPKEPALGQTYGLYAHYSFYFIKRMFRFKIGQGIAYATNPFDLETNFKNNAYGSRLLSSTFVQGDFILPRLYKGLGLHIGGSLVHYSNANFRAPNTSTNTLAVHLGLNYDLDYTTDFEYQNQELTNQYKEPWHFNAVLRFGLNESDYVSLGQHPFLVVSAFADKRLNRRSSILGGVDFFMSRFLKEEIEYRAIAFPREGIAGDEDWKRAGVFVGHELHFGPLSFLTHVGYYFYYPYDFEGQFYQRVGLKHKISENFHGSLALKLHGAKAEALAFGIGYRFN
ncbi:acyloxyacyl hydrolase [Gilvibacter sp.]|uniref:acyloxyacyl hydrolase n=1 Tax=Gilvibacter sp. TaxID=2729997 RepID=UPI0025C4D87B|nr:acyloxyacyl hydrolase [Gilvibacter sp.]NQX77891.1 acyloxyacyl hydrolase [Gilvibacter sp.]